MREVVRARATMRKHTGTSRRLLRRLASAALAALLLSAVGCGAGPYSTPEATFAKFKTAVANADWEQVCECLTPESRDTWAGAMVLGGWAAKTVPLLSWTHRSKPYLMQSPHSRRYSGLDGRSHAYSVAD